MPDSPEIAAIRRSHRYKVAARETVTTMPVCWLRLPGICTGRSTHADHIVPASRAPHLMCERTNMVGACRPCNQARGSRLVSELPALRAELADKARRRRRRDSPRASALAFFDTRPKT